MDHELKTLLPAESINLSTGEQVIVSPVPFGKMRMFSDAVSSLAAKLQANGSDLNDISLLFVAAFEETVVIMGLILDKPRPWFDTISIADGLALLDKIIEQNNAGVKKILESLVQRIKGFLSTPSKLSLVRDTASLKSAPTHQSRSSSSQGASQG